MADRLVVDVDALGELAKRLESIRTRLNDGPRTVRLVREEVGSSQVCEALEAFEEHWDDGRDKIDANAKNLAGMLRESAKAYRETDEQLRTDLESSMTGQDAP